MRDYFDYAAGLKLTGSNPPALVDIPGKDDPVATSVRLALDAHALGWSQERTAQLLLDRGGGITVEESALPDTVRTRMLSLEEMQAREDAEANALWLERAAR